VVLHQDAEERQPVHPRHFQVERHHVRVEAFDLLAGHVGVAGRADDLDLGVVGERVADRLADERRVVHDEDADLACGSVFGHADIPPGRW
jgi:hypothetical protein